MIKLKSLISENSIFVPRRSKEERQKLHVVAIQKQIQQYIKDGCEGDLNLENAPITSLPNNLKRVGGSLDLHGVKLDSLPAGLYVDEDLYLGDSSIKSLPSNLVVRQCLYLRNTNIRVLPTDLYVGEDVFLRGTPLAVKSNPTEIKRRSPDIQGVIYT